MLVVNIQMSARLITIDTSKIPNVQSGTWTSDNVTIECSPPIQLPGQYQWEVGLIRTDTWNSIHNIKAVYNNNQLRYYNGTTWRSLTLPDGNYEIADIKQFTLSCTIMAITTTQIQLIQSIISILFLS